MTVIDALSYDPFIRGKATFEVVAWDRPVGGAPMLATETPQVSVNTGLPRPSECGIVVVILWSRMGTPLPFPQFQTADGRPYASGTEWELTDAMTGSPERPYVLLYRRTAKRPIDPDAPDALELVQQKQRVNAFFDGLVDPETSEAKHGYTKYEAPENFRASLEFDLRSITSRILATDDDPAAATAAEVPLWSGSPFPGLRAFTNDDAPVFFGRGRETDLLLQRLAGSRFVAVIGASGSGKSSLVGAGLIPRLAAGALSELGAFLLPTFDQVTRQWRGLRLSPGELGDNPFFAVAARLAPFFGVRPDDIAARLVGDPSIVVRLIDATTQRHEAAEVLLFIDQFEELFTVVAPELRAPFVELLEHISASSSGRVVLTMRSDFYQRCLEIPALGRLLEQGELPLPAPDTTLLEMMTGPAARAGLQFEEGLPGRILADADAQPGSLPLLAYALDELYRARSTDGILSHAAYDALGGVAGSIGTRADEVFARLLDSPARSAFSSVFRELVTIDDVGRASRQRAEIDTVAGTPEARRLVDVFTDARLLVSTRDEAGRGIVQVAHEALFANWRRLADWIAVVQDDLRLLTRASAAALEWNEGGRRDAYLWQHERLEPVYEAIGRLSPSLDPATEAFIRPEHERLLPLIVDPSTPPYRLQATADRLVAIGGPAIPGLLDVLESGVPSARGVASSSLARLGGPAVPGLSAAARSASVDVRLAALGALRQIGDQDAVPAFAHALQDSEAQVRSLAAGALEAIGGPDAAAALAEALGSDEVDLRWRAAGLLGAFGSAAIHPLLVALGDGDPRVADQARDALEVVGAQSVDTLTDALLDPDTSVRAGAARILSALGDVAVPSLVQATHDEDPDVRWRAATSLAGIGSPAAAPAVRQLVADPEPAVRAAAVAALRGDDVETLDVLFSSLDDDDPDVRLAATDSLALIGPAVTDRLAATVVLARGPSSALAARALGTMGPAVVGPLLAALPDAGEPGQDRAIEALIAAGPGTVPALVAAMPGASPNVRRAVTAGLQAFGRAAVPDLLTMTKHEEPATRRAAAMALSGISDHGVQSALGRLLGDRDPGVRRAAAASLAAVGERAIGSLLSSLRSSDDDAAEAASEALAAIGAPAVRDLMRVAHRNSGRESAAAVRTLSRMTASAAVLGLAELGQATTQTGETASAGGAYSQK